MQGFCFKGRDGHYNLAVFDEIGLARSAQRIGGLVPINQLDRAGAAANAGLAPPTAFEFCPVAATRLRQGAAWRLGLTLCSDERGEGIRVVRMPAAERRAVLDDVAHGPGHALFVERAGNIIVGAQNVEIAAVHAVEKEIRGLFGRPGGGRKLYHHSIR